MTQRPNAKPTIGRIIEQALDERLPYFSGGAGNQDPVLLGSRVAFVARLGFMGLHVHVFQFLSRGRTAETAHLNYSVAADSFGRDVSRNSTGCIPVSLWHFVKWKLGF